MVNCYFLLSDEIYKTKEENSRQDPGNALGRKQREHLLVVSGVVVTHGTCISLVLYNKKEILWTKTRRSN